MAHRLVNFDELKRLGFPRLVVLDRQVAVRVLVGGDVVMDRSHHLPGAGHLHVAGMLLHREPPPGDRQARDHDPVIAFLLRPLLHADVHQRELVAVGLEPEIDGVLLLLVGLVVEDAIGEPAITFHAAHGLDLLEDEIEVGVELGIVEDEGAILGALGDDMGDGLFDRALVNLTGQDRAKHQQAQCRDEHHSPCEIKQTREAAHGYSLVVSGPPLAGAGADAEWAEPRTKMAWAASRFPFFCATSVAVKPCSFLSAGSAPASMRRPIIGALLCDAAIISAVMPLLAWVSTAAPRPMSKAAISVGRALPGTKRAPSAGAVCAETTISGVSPSRPEAAPTSAPPSISTFATSYRESAIASESG